MKILITYFSKTGNTKQIAEAMFDELYESHNVVLNKLENTTHEMLEEFDLIFFGSACHDAGLSKRMTTFLRGVPKNIGFDFAGFYTHSTVLADGTKRNDELFNQWAGHSEKEFTRLAKDDNKNLKGIFHCQGKASFLIEKFIRLTIIKNKKEWIPYRDEMRKHPTPEDIENARDFVRSIVS